MTTSKDVFSGVRNVKACDARMNSGDSRGRLIVPLLSQRTARRSIVRNALRTHSLSAPTTSVAASPENRQPKNPDDVLAPLRASAPKTNAWLTMVKVEAPLRPISEGPAFGVIPQSRLRAKPGRSED